MSRFAPLHDTSTFLRFVPGGWSMYVTAAVTPRTSFGGVDSDLSSVRAALLRRLSASAAAASAGSAASRSFSHWALKSDTSDWISATFSASIAAFADSSSAILDSLPTSTSSASTSTFLFSTTTDSSCSWTCMSATCADDSLSLMRPDSSLFWSMSSVARLSASCDLYSIISSRKDLGVVYTLRRSAALYRIAVSPTEVCTKAMCCAHDERISSDVSSTSARNFSATDTSASLGHGWK
mmetsp:Transcript_14445/g.43964  ORF Transcript_14445/g.43964 Transcript_14445/m.43964 type:complete len:238 (+) Transcript_14445:1277-1990(+)